MIPQACPHCQDIFRIQRGFLFPWRRGREGGLALDTGRASRSDTIKTTKEVIAVRIMAIDYGDARTGVALSDPTGFLAGQTFLIKSRKQEVVLEELAAQVQRQGAQELVMGYPRNMDGTLGPRAEKYAAFARRLEEATGLPVALWDERRTTVDAHRILGEQGVRAKNRKDKIDSVAATLILEGYLDWKRLQAQRQEREEETP